MAQMGKKVCLQFRRLGFDPWVRKIPWRREWQPLLKFLLGESPGQRSRAGYSPWGLKEMGMTKQPTPYINLPSSSMRHDPGNLALCSSFLSSQTGFSETSLLHSKQEVWAAVVLMAPHYVGCHPLLSGQRHPEIRTKASIHQGLDPSIAPHCIWGVIE